ncbi:MAG: hypothetical protein AB7N73_11245 [Gemmatimonadales bacterium]|nr:hypothetical protein [Gemmatimonadales bacterium]HRX18314.1 hypothetical protein [Gemmatimonadales bacterium]
MIIGRRWWILIWYGILLLGVAGLLAAINWGRQTKWRNTDEILRGIGTIAVSVAFLMLLKGTRGGGAAQTLLLAALIAFVLAFVVGREQEKHPIRSPETPAPDDPPDDEPTDTP